MYSEEFENFIDSYNGGQTANACTSLIKELGNILYSHRSDFIALLNHSGIDANEAMSDEKLIDLFIENVFTNKHLALGASVLASMNNKSVNFDGENVLNDSAVKAGYEVLSNAGGALQAAENIGGGAAGGGVAGAIAGAVQSGFQFGQQVALNKDHKQQAKGAVMDLLKAKTQASADMQQAALKVKQAQIDAATKQKSAASKKKRIVIIAVASLIGFSLLVGGIIIYKHNTNK